MRIGKLLSSILLFISFLIVFPNSIIADPLDSWHLRYSSSNILNTVAYGNGTFVAVGKQGTILNSVDGITWGPKTSGTSMDLEGVTYGNSTFVAVGDHGTILISPDGGTWTPRTPYSGTTENLSGIAYGNGIFVAVGDYRTVLTSPDGYTWTARTLASGTFSYFPYAVYFGNGTFVSVDVSGDIFTSTNGLTWTERESPNFFSFFGVAYGNDTFVAVGQLGTVYTSPDGTTWTERNSGTSEDFDGVAYGNNTFVAVGYSMNYGGIIFTSPDGVVWTQRNSGTNKILYGVTYGEGTFVAVGSVILQSDPIPIIIETVSIPNTPIGAASGGPGTSYSYSAGGSSSNLSHEIEYQFDWGDMSYSGWSSSTSALKSWSSPGTYIVKTQARCAIDTSVVSDWSSGLSVVINAIETVSTPSISSGPTSGTTYSPYSYAVSEAASTYGHPVEYQFDWGDGTFSPWSSSTSASTSWSSTGIFMVRVHARCAIDSSVVSGWSLSLPVTIGAGFVQRWAGPKSFNITFTETYQDAAGNIKFQSTRDTFTGTAELYSGEEGLVVNGDGCYLSFLSDDGKMTFCIKEIASISTSYVKITTTDTFYLIGTGSISVEELGEVSTGIAYLDGKGTLKKNKSGDVISITVSGKIAGGFNDAFILRGTVNAILTK